MVCQFKNYDDLSAKTVGHSIKFLILEKLFKSFIALMN